VAAKVADHRTLVTLLSRHYANILHQAFFLQLSSMTQKNEAIEETSVG